MTREPIGELIIFGQCCCDFLDDNVGEHPVVFHFLKGGSFFPQACRVCMEDRLHALPIRSRYLGR